MTNLNGDTLYEMRYLGRAFIGCRKASGQFIDEWLHDKEEQEARLSNESRVGKLKENTYLMITNQNGTVEPVLTRSQHVRHIPANVSQTTEKCQDAEIQQLYESSSGHIEADDSGMLDEILSNIPGCFEKEKRITCPSLKRRVTLINVSDTNRIMLLQTRSDRLSFISLDKKTVILEKCFEEIAYCAQGCRHPDHFAFVCKDGRMLRLVMYMFQCSSDAAVDQILQTVRAALSPLPGRESKALSPVHPPASGAMCDLCPLVQLQKLKAKLETLLDAEARYNHIHDCISRLPQRVYKELMSKVKSEQCQDFAEKNEVLTTKLTIMCQLRQLDHRCRLTSLESPQGGGEEFQLVAPQHVELPRSPSILRALRDRARKVLADRFSKKSPVTHSEVDTSSRIRRRSIHREISRELSDEECRDQGESHQGHRRRSVTWGSGSILDFIDGSVVTVPQRMPNLPSPAISHPCQKAEAMTPSIKSQPEQALSPSSEQQGGIWFETPKGLLSNDLNRAGSANLNQTIAGASLTADQENGNLPQGLQRTVSSSWRLRRERIRSLWRRASEQALLLGRLEKENSVLEDLKLRRQQLDYKEVTSCSSDAGSTWSCLLKQESINNNVSKIDKPTLRSAVIQGIPHTRRGVIWSFLAEQYVLEHRKSAAEAERMLPPALLYDAVLEEFTPERHAIFIDLGRTFPNHPYFQSQLGTGQLSLFNILKAYSLLDKEVGYCQGLCFIAGIILLHVKEDEAFHLLKHIMLVLDMREQYKPEMDAMQLKSYQLSRLLQCHHIDLYQHLHRHDADPSLYATAWFMTLFSSEFPIGFAVRVFDFLLLEGPVIIFNICLALLSVHKQLLLNARTLEDIIAHMKTVMPTMEISQVDTVFKMAMSMDLSAELSVYKDEYTEIVSGRGASSSSDEENEEKGSEHEDTPSGTPLVDVVRSLRQRVTDLRHKVKRQRLRSADQAAVIQTLQGSHFELADCVRKAEAERDALRHAVAFLSAAVPQEVWRQVQSELSDAGVPIIETNILISADGPKEQGLQKLSSGM